MNVKIDDLGRIVIPKKIRKELNITAHDSFNIYLDNEKIVIEKNKNYFKNKYIIDFLRN